MREARLLVAACGCFTAGCWGGADCVTSIGPPALVVMVTDSATGMPMAEGAYGSIARHGVSERFIPYESRGIAPDDTLLSLAATPSNGGVYFVTVSRAGYQQWQRGDVRLTRDECGFESTSVTAKLEPAP